MVISDRQQGPLSGDSLNSFFFNSAYTLTQPLLSATFSLFLSLSLSLSQILVSSFSGSFYCKPILSLKLLFSCSDGILQTRSYPKSAFVMKKHLGAFELNCQTLKSTLFDLFCLQYSVVEDFFCCDRLLCKDVSP